MDLRLRSWHLFGPRAAGRSGTQRATRAASTRHSIRRPAYFLCLYFPLGAIAEWLDQQIVRHATTRTRCSKQTLQPLPPLFTPYQVYPTIQPEVPSVPSITCCRLLLSLRDDCEYDQRLCSGANGSLSIWARLGSCQAHSLLYFLHSFRCLDEATVS